MTDLNGKNTTASFNASDQTPTKLNGIGGLLKRFSPKYRSRSKSPAAHSHQRIEKTWVTVEIKDSQVSGRSMGNNVPPTASTSSPSSPILRNGPTSPEKSPRLRGAFGNLFHRNSIKKPRDSSSTRKSAKMESRTRSEHELNGASVDGGGPKGGCLWAPPRGAAQRLARENGGDIRDGLVGTGAATRGTLSEEDLVSKSLSRERDVYKSIFPRGASTAVHSAVPATLTSSAAYHSQDSVFDTPSRMPSYVRISCTLSGYRNYRAVDLRTAQSPNRQRSPAVAPPPEEQPDGPALPSESAPPLVSVPLGKSIVERRLEKFEHPVSQQPPAPSTPAKEQTLSVDGGSNSGSTPTPIKDLISNFNKMSIRDADSPVARPRQKPPPVPPKRERLSQQEDDEDPCGQEANLLDEASPLPAEECVFQEQPLHNGQCGEDALNGAPNMETVDTRIDRTLHRLPLEDNATSTLAPKGAQVSASFAQSLQSQQREEPIDGSTVEIVVQADERVVQSVGPVDSGGMTRDGVYYQREAARERARLEKMCEQVEGDMNADNVPDEAAERIRMAVGRVRLLLGKKFKKFEELIENSLHPKLDDPRPTFVSDLEGYYELVQMEIEDIDACFEVVRRLKENNWQIVSNKDDDIKKVGKPTKQGQHEKNKPTHTPEKKNNDKQSAMARSEAAKQRLKEAKAAALQRKMQADGDTVFVADKPGCPS